MSRDSRTWALTPDTRVHLVGIGGAGMSALARILLERGQQVSGSDLRGGRPVGSLEAMGARVSVGHAASNVEDADVVVASTAVAATNPELVRAAELGIPVVHRAGLLAALIEGVRGILVSGTHGKTTTTAMTTVALQSAGFDPSFAIGGMIHEAGTSAHHGTSDVFVAEADESDRSFLTYRPDCAIVTNVELDHHDVYADLDDVAGAFGAFLDRRRPGGVAIVCHDDAGAMSVAKRAGDGVLTYGEHPDADVRAVDVDLVPDGARWTLLRDGNDLGRLSIKVPGRHNVLNATAAAAAALWAGAAIDGIAEGLAHFAGAQRRFQRVGTVEEITVVDDYAHHPTELIATIAAARQTGHRRIVALFQPHRYSRTAALGTQLGTALAAADVVVVTDVYAAGERPEPGITGAMVAEACTVAGTPATFVPGIGDLPAQVARMVQPGDLVMTLGAGDITEVGELLLREIAERGTSGVQGRPR